MVQTQYLGPQKKAWVEGQVWGFHCSSGPGQPFCWPVRHKAANREVTLRALEILQETVEDKGRFQNHKILKFLLIFLRVFPNFPKRPLSTWACFNGGELLSGLICQELSTPPPLPSAPVTPSKCMPGLSGRRNGPR